MTEGLLDNWDEDSLPETNPVKESISRGSYASKRSTSRSVSYLDDDKNHTESKCSDRDSQENMLESKIDSGSVNNTWATKSTRISKKNSNTEYESKADSRESRQHGKRDAGEEKIESKRRQSSSRSPSPDNNGNTENVPRVPPPPSNTMDSSSNLAGRYRMLLYNKRRQSSLSSVDSESRSARTVMPGQVLDPMDTETEREKPTALRPQNDHNIVDIGRQNVSEIPDVVEETQAVRKSASKSTSALDGDDAPMAPRKSSSKSTSAIDEPKVRRKKSIDAEEGSSSRKKSEKSKSSKSSKSKSTKEEEESSKKSKKKSNKEKSSSKREDDDEEEEFVVEESKFDMAEDDDRKWSMVELEEALESSGEESPTPFDASYEYFDPNVTSSSSYPALKGFSSWMVSYSEEGHRYFYDETTGVSQWTDPRVDDDPELRPGESWTDLWNRRAALYGNDVRHNTTTATDDSTVETTSNMNAKQKETSVMTARNTSRSGWTPRDLEVRENQGYFVPEAPPVVPTLNLSGMGQPTASRPQENFVPSLNLNGINHLPMTTSRDHGAYHADYDATPQNNHHYGMDYDPPQQTGRRYVLYSHRAPGGFGDGYQTSRDPPMYSSREQVMYTSREPMYTSRDALRTSRMPSKSQRELELEAQIEALQNQAKQLEEEALYSLNARQAAESRALNTARHQAELIERIKVETRREVFEEIQGQQQHQPYYY